MFSLNLSLGMGAVFCLVVAFIFALLLTFKKGYVSTNWFMIISAHYFTQLIFMFYPLIFSQRYDLLYISLYMLLVLHWNLFKGECLLSYLEKKELNKNYVLGENIYSHPYLDDLIGNTHVMFVLNVISTITVSYVLYRYFMPLWKWSIILIIINAIYNLSLLSKRYYV